MPSLPPPPSVAGAHAAPTDLGGDLAGPELRAGLEGHLASHRHFFRALRSKGPNTIRTMTAMTSISPMIYGTGTRAVSSSNQLRTTVSGEVAGPSPTVNNLGIRNRPSGATS